MDKAGKALRWTAGRPAPGAGPATAPYRRRAAVAGAALAASLLTASCGSDYPSDDGNVRPVGGSSDLGSGYTSGSGYGSDGGYGDSGGDDGSGEYGSSGGEAGGGGSRTGAARTLKLQDSPELGQVVTDSEGWTLYRFDEDSADPPSSSCAGSCAETWPPVPAEDVSPASGIDASKLGRVRRDDGSWQLTLGGWPVYRYAGDNAPGDTAGHGVGDTWYALSPDGGKAGASAAGGQGAGAAQLKAVRDAALGTILTDARGRTLYRFDKDSAWPMKSNCTGACLDTWKPAKPVDPEQLDGVAADLVSTYQRPDGTGQLAVDCWPLYWFTGDDGPGDTSGHGKQGLWSAVTEKGGKAGS